jgi:hypothetical protein
MIKVIAAHYLGDFRLALDFSDGAAGEFDGQTLLQRSGPLLDPLRSEAYSKPHNPLQNDDIPLTA